MSTLTRSKISLIKSLSDKKNRDETGLFFVEGIKIAEEVLASDLEIVSLFHTDHYPITPNLTLRCKEVFAVSQEQMERLTHLKNASSIAILARKPSSELVASDLTGCLSLALDRVQDPGNLGTIIRIADWFGIRHIICSSDCADCYNSKVLQSTMGSFLRVNVVYKTNLKGFLSDLSSCGIPICGTFLDGDNIYTQALPACGVIVMGNEGKGIDPGIAQLVEKRLLIPSFTDNNTGSESLNVGVATALVCAEFRRRIQQL